MPSTMNVARRLDDLGSLGGDPFAGLRVAQQVQRELVTQRGVLGAAVAAQLAPPLGDVVELACADLVRRRHHLGEIVEVAAPVPVADCKEEVLLGGEVLVDGALRVAGSMGDVVESRWGEALFGEHLLGGIQQQRAGVLQAPLPRPLLRPCVGLCHRI